MIFRDGHWAAVGPVEDHHTVKATKEGDDLVVSGVRPGEETAVELGRYPHADVRGVAAALVWPEA